MTFGLIKYPLGESPMSWPEFSSDLQNTCSWNQRRINRRGLHCEGPIIKKTSNKFFDFLSLLKSTSMPCSELYHASLRAVITSMAPQSPCLRPNQPTFKWLIYGCIFIDWPEVLLSGKGVEEVPTVVWHEMLVTWSTNEKLWHRQTVTVHCTRR